MPDLVVLDVMMPRKNGWEVARELRADPQLHDVGIVMLTAIGEKINEMTSPLYGADEYVDKPFDFADLESRIRRVLEAKKESKPAAFLTSVHAPARWAWSLLIFVSPF